MPNLSDNDNSTQKPTEAAELDLRLSLKNSDLDQAQVKALTSNLIAAFQGANIPLSRINWEEFTTNSNTHPT